MTFDLPNLPKAGKNLRDINIPCMSFIKAGIDTFACLQGLQILQRVDLKWPFDLQTKG